MSIKRLANASITGSGGKSSKLWDQTTTMGTFESIATVTCDSSAPQSFVFSNIPQNYTHLQIRMVARGTQASSNNYALLQFNNDVLGYNYRAHWLQGDGANATAGADSAASTYLVTPYLTGATAAASTFGTSIIDILDYTSTTKNKVVRSIGGYDLNGSGIVAMYSGIWFISPIAPITILSVFFANIAQYSQISLYGIRGA